MSVKVTTNVTNIKSQTQRSASLGLRFLLDAVQQSADPKTPKRLGFLRRGTVTRVEGLHGSIAWKPRYAVFQELRRYGHYTTPGTGPHYAENAVRKEAAVASQHFHRAGLV